jgi:hypothetical protein
MNELEIKRREIARAKGLELHPQINAGFEYYKAGVSAIGIDEWKVLPNWPRDVAAAFTLLDEVEAAGLRWMLYTLADGVKNCAINKPVMIEDEEHWQLVAEQQADTAEVAICLAYADWQEGEKESTGEK